MPRVAAPRLLRRQRRLPLPRPGVRRAAVRPRRRRSASRGCGSPPPRCLRRSGAGPWRTLAARPRPRLLVAWGAVLAVMNCCFYAGDRPAAARHRRGDRVPARHRAGRARRAHAAQRRRARARRRRASTCSPASTSRASRWASRSRSPTPRCSPPTSCSPTASRSGRRSTASTASAPRCSSPPSWSRRSAGWAAVPAFGDPVALAAGIGVGISSSVIPYVCRPARDARACRARPTR